MTGFEDIRGYVRVMHQTIKLLKEHQEDLTDYTQENIGFSIASGLQCVPHVLTVFFLHLFIYLHYNRKYNDVFR